MDESATEITSDLIDLGRGDLATLGSYDQTILAAATEPLLRQIDKPTNSVGGHNS